jgi:polyferredoxin
MHMAAVDSVASVDILRWPVIGPLLRWRHARTALQCAALAVAAAMVLHGLLGPQIAPRNLATVLTWVHYRGLLVIALLAAGNLFCMGCPFVLVRDAARRQRAPRRSWPARLRNKWIGIALFAMVLFTYELFDLWAMPRATAWLILAYFAAALAIDVVFTGATFCKYLCPIGQFNFAAATLSPLEVMVRQPAVCTTCRTVDCIRGRRDAITPTLTIRRGCELGLFQPAKIGNIDCTFCLDCVQACPHDNVAIAARLPGAELVDGRRRSGIGRLAARPDIAALAILFAFGALLNAFAMVTPVYQVEQWLAGVMHTQTEAPVLLVIFVLALVAIPAGLLIGAAASTRRLTMSRGRSMRSDIIAYAVALLPLGFGLWIAHYGFHLLTGVLTIAPVTQSAAADLAGWPVLGNPQWRLAGMRPGVVFPIQIGFVVLGMIGSLAVARGISEREYPETPLAATIPWSIVLLILAAAALWVLSNPMEMRAVGFLG